MRIQRRKLLALLGASTISNLALSQGRIPIADAHNHLGLLRRNADVVPRMATIMRDSGVNLLSWTIVPDAPFLRVTSSGVEQGRQIRPGELASSFERQFSAAKARIDDKAITVVRTMEDLQRASEGNPCVVLTSEGADFLGMVGPHLLRGDGRKTDAVGNGRVDAQLQCPIPNPVMARLDAAHDFRVLPYAPGDLEAVMAKNPVYRRAVIICIG